MAGNLVPFLKKRNNSRQPRGIFKYYLSILFFLKIKKKRLDQKEYLCRLFQNKQDLFKIHLNCLCSN